MEMMEDVAIVGAGIAVLAIAVALKRVGIRALVLEKSKGLRSTGTALTLTPNAWLALDALVPEKFKKSSSYLDVVRHADLSTLTWAPLKFRQPWGIIFGKLSKGNVTVAGDAMHPMTPDLGQGGGSSLEDAVVLGRHIGNSFINNGGLIVPGDMAKAIDDYLKERRWRTAFLVTGSYLAGWVQLGGDKWWMKFLRDGIFYKYLFGRISGLVHKDCGKLPAMSFGDMDHSSKKD
ncbi:hypothetical protein H0E87_031189 [Populus deltoides]|uniref:FAD-binding domain-containing protein n=1 Tax=Populus deltoides TaxID=3696 RepID=A0A8T2WIJ8_POPDE|nr:hypothetical protein H0E87_031189 [Populus deltoides]